MTKIGIVTDSSCDLPAAVVRRHGIGVVPLTVRFGDEVLTDGVDLSAADFWQRLGGARDLPETAAPSPGAFLEAFGRAEDVDGIVCLCLSTQLSGTFQAAVLAAEEAPIPIKVVDSGVVSLALGLVAVEAAVAAAAGQTLEEVAAVASDAAARANVFAALDTLEFLERGGRVGRVSAILGGLLDIKPLITLDAGVVAAGGRVRTRSKAVTAVADHLAGRTVARYGLIHSGVEAVPRLIEAIAERTTLAVDDPIVAELGPVVGTHTGPGVLGAAYIEA
jgi:DegV family protein with EDD domain